DLTPDLARAFDLEVSRGAVITQVEARSPAEHAGLRAGDVLVGLNRREVRSLDDLRSAAQATRGSALLLNIQRGSSAFFLMLQ
ncbi:MAG: PDZ domain-containing protein, partial [Thioalkalivibrio sp.]|nr:PDZ domain-containing protein [Thioalkalivibrio sp.]